MGQKLSIGIPPLADPEQEPITEGTRATCRQPQQELSSSATASSGSPTPSGGAAAPQSPAPVPAKRWCSSPPAAERWVGEDGVPFHVHQEDGIRICDAFLVGRCPRRESCPLHHTRYPFHWQIRGSQGAAWRSLGDSSQRHLEKLYSQVENSLVRFLDGNRSLRILDLDTMELGCSDVGSRARRLGSTSDWKQNPWFHTRWQLYWKQGDMWLPYEEPVPRDLLAVFERGSQEPTFRVQGQLYTLEPRPPQQSTEGPGSVRPIQLQRRPAYRSLSGLARYLRTIPRGSRGLFHPSTSTIPGERPTDGYCGPYPAAWVPQPPRDQAFLHAEVASSEAVYRQICELFHASVSEDAALVLRIYRIRNDGLWEKYRSRKEQMSQGLSAQEKRLLERHLFHGTSADNVESICRANFNPRLSGKHGAHYGHGTYFSVVADCSHNFALANHAHRRHMFLAKVLVGKWVPGRPGYTQPPGREPAGRRYDSCIDNPREPSLYVIFDNAQCYPYFVICYKLLGDPVTLDGVGGAGPRAGDGSPAGRLPQPGFSTL